MRAYLAGPMRGYEQYNFPAFDRARDFLITKGWNPISPADLDRNEGITGFTTDLPPDFIFNALRRDFMALCQCEAIVFLSGWEESEGANAEKFVAEHIGLPMYFIDTDTGELYDEEGVFV